MPNSVLRAAAGANSQSITMQRPERLEVCCAEVAIWELESLGTALAVCWKPFGIWTSTALNFWKP